MTRREVLHVCHSYYPPFLDVARQYNALFPREQWRITTVFLSGKADAVLIDIIGGDEVIFLEQTPASLRGLKLGLIAKLRDIAATHHFSFAIAHRFKALYLCTQISGLFTFGVHHRPGGYKRWARRWYVRWKKSRLGLIGVSDFVRDDMRAALPDFAPEQIVTLYNHIDLDRMRALFMARDEARRQLQLSTSEYLFVSIGRLHPDKDPHTLLRGFAKYCSDNADGRLVIIGKGRLDNELKQFTRDLGIAERVIFTGAIADAWKYLRAFDSFVLASNYEPFGMVLLEAMAAGLPIATTHQGGAGEVIGDIGFRFEVGDADTLSQLFSRLRMLDTDTIDNLHQRMEMRLLNYFSDAAVRAVFWSLSIVSTIAKLNRD